MTNNKPPFYQDENPKPIFCGYDDTEEIGFFDKGDYKNEQ